MIPALFAVAPCFPLCWAGGQASTTGSFGRAGVPCCAELPPRCLGYQSRGKEGQGLGKEARGREKELILEISRKEAKSFNAPLAEILGKMGTSRAKLKDFVLPQVIVTLISLGETAAGPLVLNMPQTVRRAANSQALISSFWLSILEVCSCSCPHFINQHFLLCFLPS